MIFLKFIVILIHLFIRVPLSFVMNAYYFLRIGFRNYKEYKQELDDLIAKELHETNSLNDACSFVGRHFGKYLADPVRGLIDWTSNPVIQYARRHEGLLTHSNDCDDFSSALKYVLKQTSHFDKVYSAVSVSKIPFVIASHSYVFAKNGGDYYVFSPYRYLGISPDKSGIVDYINEAYDGLYEYFDFYVTT